MLNTLHGKLSLALLLLLIPVGALYVWSTVKTSQRYNQAATQEANVRLAGQLVEHYDLMIERTVNARNFAPMLATLHMTNPTVDIYVLDTQGKILASSAKRSELKTETVPLEPIETFIRSPVAFPFTSENPIDLTHKDVFSAARIPSQGPLEGYLYIVLCNDLHASAIVMVRNSTILRLGAWIVMAGLALTFLVGVLIFTLFTRRLKILAAAMMDFQKNDFKTLTDLPPPQPRFNDEVTDLTRVFTNMANRMAEQVATVQQSDQLRRELVANVSHDLRTPLTTLQGYLETALLSAPSKPARQEYLNLALRQTLRLGKLIGELFELGKLEANAVQIQKEPFSIAELCQDVVSEFQLAADQKGIHLRADLKVFLFVRADVGFIERVLQNLLDNALQHTPPNGIVSVTLESATNGVTVTVRDTGSGIAPAELPHIFERYYKAPRTAEGKAAGAGLGLAISQRMLKLHQSQLTVSSELGGGTTFSFTLKTYIHSNGWPTA